jgi:hypothetical protein
MFEILLNVPVETQFSTECRLLATHVNGHYSTDVRQDWLLEAWTDRMSKPVNRSCTSEKCSCDFFIGNTISEVNKFKKFCCSLHHSQFNSYIVLDARYRMRSEVSTAHGT